MTSKSFVDASQEVADLKLRLTQADAALVASVARETGLRRELEHRVRNALAVTRSVFARTMANAMSVEQARDHFSGRLDALARYQTRLAAMSTSTFDLETMIWDELVVVASVNDERVTVRGPAVDLGSRVAEVIGLALHELATNSVKFGVLGDSAGKGRLQIEWQVQSDAIRFAWQETGVSIIASAPIESGFGQEYIEQAIPYQLGAETSFALLPGGLTCRIVFQPDRLPRTGPHEHLNVELH